MAAEWVKSEIKCGEFLFSTAEWTESQIKHSQRVVREESRPHFTALRRRIRCWTLDTPLTKYPSYRPTKTQLGSEIGYLHTSWVTCSSLVHMCSYICEVHVKVHTTTYELLSCINFARCNCCSIPFPH